MAVYLFRDWVRDLDSMRPSQIVDQHFGLGLHPEDLLTPFLLSHRAMRGPNYYRPWKLTRQDSGSVVKYDKDQFQVNLDVQQFTPEEIQVKVVDNSIVVEGKHEEKQDEHGYISRHFIRKYSLPEGHDVQDIKSSLSSDGILTITAPKVDGDNKEERNIPITQTGPVNCIKENAETSENEEKAENADEKDDEN